MFLNMEKCNQRNIAMIDDSGTKVTYQEMCDFCFAYKNAVEKRSLLFLLCENTIGAMANYLACVENGTVPLLLNAAIDPGLLGELYETYQPEYICLPEHSLEDRKELLEGAELVLRQYGYVVVKTGCPKCPMHDELALLMSTSGSTGSPKLVRYRKENLEANARNVAKVFGWTEQEKPVCDLPMNYTMGLNVINSHLVVGATVVLTDYNLMSADYWELVKREQCTNFTGVPFSFSIMARLRINRMALPHLTTIAEGGGRLSDDEFRMWAEYAAQNGKRFCATFGTTETAARMAYLPPEWAVEKTGSIGRAIPQGELFLLDVDGKEIPEMEAEGELGYRGPNVTMGYATCRDELQLGDDFKGVYHTGDIAKRDQDGCYYIIGRKSRFLKLLGLRVNLDECERLIRDAYHIDNVCTGTDEKMVVYITSEQQCAEVRSFLSKKLKLYISLFEVKYIAEIPRSSTGKVMYQQLV